MEKLQQEFSTFMSDLETRFATIGIDLFSHPVDHACYRAADTDTYKKLFETLKQISVLYTTKFFHERSFHAFVLKAPLEFKGIKVSFIEFAEPGGSDNYETGFQHIEFHTNLELADLSSNKEELQKLLFEGKHGDEIYLKWEDKVSLKVTKNSIITKALTEDSPVITVL